MLTSNQSSPLLVSLFSLHHQPAFSFPDDFDLRRRYLFLHGINGVCFVCAKHVILVTFGLQCGMNWRKRTRNSLRFTILKTQTQPRENDGMSEKETSEMIHKMITKSSKH